MIMDTTVFKLDGKIVASFTVTEDGDVVYLNTPHAVAMFQDDDTVTQRASHVEPDSFVFRVLFHALRFVFGDKGRMSDFTRHWPCLWRVNTGPVGGPIFLKRYTNRQEAIDAEVEFLIDWFSQRSHNARATYHHARGEHSVSLAEV
jgi:hypothetical protein